MSTVGTDRLHVLDDDLAYSSVIVCGADQSANILNDISRGCRFARRR